MPDSSEGLSSEEVRRIALEVRQEVERRALLMEKEAQEHNKDSDPDLRLPSMGKVVAQYKLVSPERLAELEAAERKLRKYEARDIPSLAPSVLDAFKLIEAELGSLWRTLAMIRQIVEDGDHTAVYDLRADILAELDDGG